MTELLAGHTTFGIGGPAGSWLMPASEEELVAALGVADDAGTEVLILGGGSNVLISDEGFPGLVIHTGALRGIHAEGAAGGSAVLVTAAAGEPWDAFVAHCCAQGWVGIEALSGIPGFVGATPIQNVGAYGQEVASVIVRVRVWDRIERSVHTFSAGECGFGYRNSRFKREPNRWVVLSVSFQLLCGELSSPIRYSELARVLHVDVGERAVLGSVREAVLALRRGKGMVYDRNDHDSWSAGSFFTNPILADASQVPDGAPSYPQPDGGVKTSAAWLIEHAGFTKGHGVGEARISQRHCLALTNRGQATAQEILALAREIRRGVEAAYRIRLVPEPVLVGLSMDH